VASAVLAAPSLPDSNRAGKIFTLGDGTIQFVNTTVSVPQILGGKVGSSGFAFAGIDGTADCPGGMLQVGVKFTVITGGTSYKAAYRYGVGSMGSFDDLDIAAGNTIQLTVNMPVGKTLGTVTVKNLSNDDQTRTRDVQLNGSLCGKTAEWVVEEDLPLFNFGALEFKNTQVGGNDFKSQNLGDVSMTENGSSFTSVSAMDPSDYSFTVAWVRL